MRFHETYYFALLLFLALVALIKWKRRRDLAIKRMNRGLRGYVATEVPQASQQAEKERGKNLIPIP
jgi:hypothetical protein